MKNAQTVERLERHCLVVPIWMAFVFCAATLLHHGYLTGSWRSILSGFAAIIVGFLGHVIANAVLRVDFTSQEVALGLVAYCVGLVSFGVATLFVADFAPGVFLATAGGFIAIFLAVLFYMATAFGVRRAFSSFDVIRDFGADENKDLRS